MKRERVIKERVIIEHFNKTFYVGNLQLVNVFLTSDIEGKDDYKIGINWASIGLSSLLDTKVFIVKLNEAVKYANDTIRLLTEYGFTLVEFFDYEVK